MAASALMAVALLLAVWVDHAWGEPPVRLHPVVWMGNYLNWAGQHVAPPDTEAHAQSRWARAGQFVGGALLWALGALAVGLLAWLLQSGVLLWLGGGALWQALLGAALLALALKPLLAWRMLRREVLAVEAALGESLAEGRARLRFLVSRDVAALSATDVRESAIETLAENLNDSVVAPLFWFVLLGLPGAAVYRFANTADAMWGYRGVRNGQVWEWAGKWAAWADDALSWVPARITALLLLLAACAHPGSGGPRAVVLRALVRHAAALPLEARRTPSPNSGWPMAAMALVLGVRLHKPAVYVLNATAPPPQARDTQRAVALAHAAVGVALLACMLAFGLLWLNAL